MDVPEVGWGGMDWIDLAEERDSWQTVVKCGSDPSGSIKYGRFLD